MKHLSILLFMLLLSLTGLKAQVIVVQNGTTALITSTLDSAILLAQPNAYIYLPGNYTFTVGANITKRINLVGAGYNPDSSKATGITSISSNVTFASGSQFSTITGINFASVVTFNASNLSISRCRINGSFNLNNPPPSNTIINECVFNGNNGNQAFSGGSSTANNIIVQKCIFQHTGSVSLTSCNNIIFNNNLFLCLLTSAPAGTAITSDVFNCQFNNNIFTHSSAIPFVWSSGSNNVFNNNLFARSSFSLPGTSTNNIFNDNLSTMFVNAPPLTPWSSTQNYNLSPTSLGNNAGTDGTDVGIYGTSLPWKDGGIPFNPHFQIVNIPGSTGTNGQLNISIKVAAQQN